MAVTTKTLTPTNQTVTLPDMTERPDASVLVTDISREADAINAIASQIGDLGMTYLGQIPTTGGTFTVGNNSRIMLVSFFNNTNGVCLMHVYSSSGGAVSIFDYTSKSHTMLTFSSSGNNNLTIANGGSYPIPMFALVFAGSIS